jgi:phosphoglycolate phosphatase
VIGSMRPDALVFDLDGTLWDAASATARGWNLALEEMGAASRVDVADIRSVCGTPFTQCVETLLPELCPPSDAVLESLDAHERAALETYGGILYPGVADGLRELAGVYRLFLVSNCPVWYLETFLRTSGFRELFTGWECHGSSGSPKTVMLRDLCKRSSLGRAVYVGDTQGDQNAAEEAGMGFVFARYGFGCASTSPAFDDFSALVEHFLG